MGNMQCPAGDASLLAAFARDFCPFPTYYPSPHYATMLSINSSIDLREHYTAVQSSLNPKQLEDFTQRLKTTFGREGRVTHGGTGIVALSLAFLFDILAKQVKGESVPDSGLIPGLFLKDPRGYYSQRAHTLSSYLRLVPHIANNATRMTEKTERYLSQLAANAMTLKDFMSVQEDVAVINLLLELILEGSMKLHLQRLKNYAVYESPAPDSNHGDLNITFSLNCVPEVADKEFLAKVQQADNRTKKAFESCKPDDDEVPQSWMRHVAELEWTDVVFFQAILYTIATNEDMIACREDFDLKANSLVKWAE